jgi:hypothetical protein
MQHLMGNKLKKTFLSAGKTVKDLERCLCSAGWWLVLICCERKILLASWWLVLN